MLITSGYGKHMTPLLAITTDDPVVVVLIIVILVLLFLALLKFLLNR
jgi:hypothetical protein